MTSSRTDSTARSALADSAVPAGTAQEVSGHSFRTAKLRVGKKISESTGGEGVDDAKIESEFQLPPDLTRSLESLRRKREMLDMMEREVADETTRLTKILLQQFGLSIREGAKLVGLSFQRLAAIMGDKDDK